MVLVVTLKKRDSSASAGHNNARVGNLEHILLLETSEEHETFVNDRSLLLLSKTFGTLLQFVINVEREELRRTVVGQVHEVVEGLRSFFSQGRKIIKS